MKIKLRHRKYSLLEQYFFILIAVYKKNSPPIPGAYRRGGRAGMNYAPVVQKSMEHSTQSESEV